MPDHPVEQQVALAFNRANAAFRMHRWTEALAQAEMAVGRQPDLVVAWILKARAHTQLVELEAAQSTYERAIGVDPNEFSAHLELGHVYRRMGEAVAARKAYGRAAAIRPDDRRPYLALVRLLEQAGAAEHEAAAVHYERALEADRDDPLAQADTHLRIATYRLEARDAPRALEALRAAEPVVRQLAPNSELCEDIALQRARALFKLGLTGAAETALAGLKTSGRDNILRRAADLAFQFNAHALAVLLLARIVDLRPADGSAELALADMLVRSWRLSEGDEALGRARAKGGVPEALLLATSATLALRTGDVETAIRCFRQLHVLGGPTVRSRIAMSSLYADRSSPTAVAMLHRELFADLARTRGPWPRSRTGANGTARCGSAW